MDITKCWVSSFWDVLFRWWSALDNESLPNIGFIRPKSCAGFVGKSSLLRNVLHLVWSFWCRWAHQCIFIPFKSKLPLLFLMLTYLLFYATCCYTLQQSLFKPYVQCMSLKPAIKTEKWSKSKKKTKQPALRAVQVSWVRDCRGDKRDFSGCKLL